VTAQELLERLNLLDENERIEAKRADETLMHRSYRSHASVQIIRYSNRLEIRNPGFSLKSPDHLGEPGSLPRNPKLAAALYDTRFAEIEEVRELVVALCQHRDCHAEELALLLARNVETVRQNYLRPLLRAGRICMTRPDVPNDPEQAYRVVEERP